MTSISRPTIPTGPPDLATTVALMAKIGASHNPSFTPNGQHLAFTTDLSGVPQVWTVSVQGG